MIDAIDICKRYRNKVVLDGVCLSVSKGSCVGIVGSNGCGKTTLLSILSGTMKAERGSLKFQGEEAFGYPGIFLKYAAYVPQENPIIEELSVRDNLRLWYRGDKNSMKADLEQGTAGMLGINNFLNMTAGRLSGGMKKRLSIACALSNHAPVLIMDEPGAALDLECKEDIRSYLEGYREQGGTVLMASHELAELSLCDSLYVLKHGKLSEVPAGLSAKELIERFV